MKHKIENDFQQKIMFQSWDEPFEIKTLKDVQAWRDSWSAGLKSWHSPYKTLIDLRQVTISDEDGEVAKAIQRMIRFFEGFFLKKAVGFGSAGNKDSINLPFPVVADEDLGAAEVGLREKRAKPAAQDFRSAIQLQNHFNQHVVEMNFSESVVMRGKDEVLAIKSKLTNNLMQWHSKWSLLIDCVNLTVEEDAKVHWQAMEKFFRGFFLKAVYGYSPSSTKESYPFETFRARHNAAGRIENEGNFAGDEAVCKTKS